MIVQYLLEFVLAVCFIYVCFLVLQAIEVHSIAKSDGWDTYGGGTWSTKSAKTAEEEQDLSYENPPKEKS